MKIYNQSKTELIENPDFEKGYLANDTMVVHHDAVEGVEEVGHYVTLREYPNGGKDVEWVVDVKGVKPQAAYDETVDVTVYVPYTQEELRKQALEKELAEHKEWLSDHDYIGTKIATGRATIDDYKEEIAEMRTRAERIDEIEKELAGV